MSINGYSEIKILAQGHERIIYSGRRDADQLSVVLKLLKSEHPELDTIALLYHEYEMSKDLDYPGIIKTYSLIDQENHYGLVQENMQGISLHEYLQKNPIIELDTFFNLSIQMAKILGYVQQQNIIHKDIKPSNFIINPKSLQLKITDFNFSSKLYHEIQDIVPPNKLEGTLEYMAPEQTGRMNINIDFRADFYSLGVTFYEMLTGEIPFIYTDPLEIIHAHLANKVPIPLNSDFVIPPVLIEIVYKMMSKNPVDRYQSAIGIEEDLKKCQILLNTKGGIESFSLASKDMHDHLTLSQKLYGREEEIKTLLHSYKRVSEGAVEALMVCGYSGIGKTMLINEVHKPMVKQRGYYISGKFDQLQRNTPYTAITQAFNQLARLILAESEDRFETIKNALLNSLGSIGQVLIDLAPDLQLILGPQLPLEKLSPRETQNRMMIFFKRFLHIIATKDQPLVLFIDDLQWVDSGSLKLLEYIMTDEDLSHVLLIGAYRDNEVDEHHSLTSFLNELNTQKKTIHHISLIPLEPRHFELMFQDSFSRDALSVKPLASLIHKQTAGNPFFCKQVIGTLYKEKLLYFEYEQRQWSWNLEGIKALKITDNVVELMLSKYIELPDDTQKLLKYAACIGNRFTIDTLAVISGKSDAEIGKLLWPALQLELILTLRLGYKRMDALNHKNLKKTLSKEITFQFIHDRVQQAIYDNILTNEKQNTHLTIARLLIKKESEACQKERLFEVTDHFNQALSILEDHEIMEVINLNYQAGLQALIANAYKPMAGYLNCALGLTNEKWWRHKHELMFKLNLSYVQSLYLNGEMKQAVALAEHLLERAKNVMDKVNIYRLQCIQFVAEGQLPIALEAGLKALSLLGVNIARKPSRFSLLFKIMKINILLRDHKLSSLETEIPPLLDSKLIAAFEILNEVLYLCFFLPGEMNLGVSLEAMSLILIHGSPPSAGLWVTMYAFTRLNFFKNIDDTFELLNLAERFSEQKNNKYTSAAAYNYSAYWMQHLRYPHNYRYKYYQLAIQNALESGNLLSAGVAKGCLITSSWWEGKSCAELLGSMNNSITYFRTYNMKDNVDRTEFRIAIIERYMKGTHDLSLESLFELYKIILQGKNLYYQKMADQHMAAFLFHLGRFEEAYQFHLNWYVEEKKMHFDVATLNQKTIDGLTISKLIIQSSFQNKRFLKHRFKELYKDQKWAAEGCPHNYLHHFLLLKAAKAKMEGNYLIAIESLNQAIENAKKGDFYFWAALANEWTGDLYIELNQPRAAVDYIKEAHYYYELYGMLLKVNILEEHYPQFFSDRGELRNISKRQSMGSSSANTTSASLDLMSVIKASQTISGAIVLNQLIDKMLRIILENAGAEKVFFLERRKNEWYVVANLELGQAQVNLIETPLKEFPNISHSIIQFTIRSEKPVILHNAAEINEYRHDPYIVSVQPKSVLCLPVLHLDQVIGIIYLENNLTIDAFTENRVIVLTTLAAQIAISLENSRSLERMRQLYLKTERFVPTDFLNKLHKNNIEEVGLGEHVQIDVAAMFVDIRNFTTLSEQLEPKRLVALLNLYLGCIAPIIRKHHGFVGHFLGDGILALFPRTCDDSIKAALEMQSTIISFNEDIKIEGFLPLEMGIAVHYGACVLSILGEPERLDANIISDAINTTSRIENLNKYYNTHLLISETAYKQLTVVKRYLIRIVDKIRVKGKTQSLKLYEVQIKPKDKKALKEAADYIIEFNNAFLAYESARFSEAIEILRQCLQANPNDSVAHLLMKRCIELNTTGIPEDWDGIVTFLDK